MCKEKDPESKIRLWPAPKEILNLISDGDLIGITSLINLMEIRSVLSRKKLWAKEEIFLKEDELKSSLDIVIPTWTDHIQSDKLQRKTFLYPTDCLIVTLAKNENSILLTRDAELLSQHEAPSNNPEDFLREYFPDVQERLSEV